MASLMVVANPKTKKKQRAKKKKVKKKVIRKKLTVKKRCKKKSAPKRKKQEKKTMAKKKKVAKKKTRAKKTTSRKAVAKRKPRPRARRRKRDGLTDIINSAVIPAVIGGGGAVLLDMALSKLPLPGAMQSAPGRMLVRAAGAVGGGMVLKNIVGNKIAGPFMTGALTLVAADATRMMLGNFFPNAMGELYPDEMIMGEYVSDYPSEAIGVGEYVSEYVSDYDAMDPAIEGEVIYDEF